MADNTLWVLEGPQTMREGETVTYSLTWLGGTNLSTPSAIVYKNGTVVTTAVMPSGSHSVSGNVQTLKPVTIPAGYGGSTIVVEASCIVDGNTEKRGIQIKCLKPGATL